MEFKNDILNKLDIKVTMGRYLEIERELGVNPLEMQKDYQLMEAMSTHEKIRKELEALSPKEKKKDDLKINTLIAKLNIARTKIETIQFAKSFELLELLSKTDLSENENITRDALEEFMYYYNEKTASLFNIKSEDEVAGDAEKK